MNASVSTCSSSMVRGCGAQQNFAGLLKSTAAWRKQTLCDPSYAHTDWRSADKWHSHGPHAVPTSTAVPSWRNMGRSPPVHCRHQILVRTTSCLALVTCGSWHHRFVSCFPFSTPTYLKAVAKLRAVPRVLHLVRAMLCRHI